MKRRWCGFIFLLTLGMPAFGQVSEASLRSLYGKPVDGSYVVRPGVTIATSAGLKGEACVLTIWGPTTEAELMAIVDQAVPPASRGLALGGVLECMGICKSTREYERVTVSSFVKAGQTASLAAIVISKSKSCEGRAREARAQNFSIEPKLRERPAR